MSFRCEHCGRTSAQGKKMNRVVIETRAKEYTDYRDHVIGRGWETIRELGVCGECIGTKK